MTLTLDNNGTCNNGAGDTASILSWAVLVYPVGVPVIFAILLFRVRRELQGERETLLSSALGFLHREYEPRYFWWARRSTACRVP